MFIAAQGWDHAAWSGFFYPNDMPTEWRLAYYSSEFRAVVVPAACWRNADAVTLAQWVMDTGEGFHFLLAVEGERPPTPLVQALGERFGGLVMVGDPAVACWEGGADVRALRDVIAGLPADGVLVVTGEPPSLPALRAAQTIAQLLGL